MKTILFITLILVYSSANCMTYYVSPDGIDHANGTIEKPFKSIQFGVNQLFGDTLIIRSGRYEESIKIPHLTQNSEKTRTKSKILRMKQYNYCSDPLKPSWKNKLGIYIQQNNNDIWQFFANNEMQTSARWPNAKAGVLKCGIKIQALFSNQKIVVMDFSLMQKVRRTKKSK